MNESIQCPTCRRRLPLRADLIGREVRCPICAVTFVAEPLAPPAPAPVFTPAPAAAHPPAQAAEIPWPYSHSPPMKGVSAEPPRPKPFAVPPPVFAAPDDFPRGPLPRHEPYDIFEDAATEPVSFAPPFPAPAASPRLLKRGAGESLATPPTGATWHASFIETFTNWSPREQRWLNVSVSLIVFGVLAAVLPLFGLQFRKLHLSPRGHTIAGLVSLGLGVGLGGVVIQIRLLRRSAPIRWVGLIVVALLVLYVALSVNGLGLFGR